jgi:Mg-chelatase subunit ChlD
MTLQPDGDTEDRPLFIVFCVDSSSSMNFGNRLQIVKDGVIRGVQNLSTADRFAFVEFADEANTVVEPVAGTKTSDIADKIDTVVGHGNTNLIDGLGESRKILEELERETDTSRTPLKTIALLTDGAPSEYNWDSFPELGDRQQYEQDGEVEHAEVHRDAGEILNEDKITLHAAGVGGYSLNVIEALATSSGGEWAHFSSEEEVGRFFYNLIEDLRNVAVTNPIIELTPHSGVTIENVIQQVPQVARPKVESHGKRRIVFMSDVRAQKPPRISFDLQVPELECGVEPLVDLDLIIQDQSITKTLEAKIVPASIRDGNTDNGKIRENHRTATGIEEDVSEMDKEEAADEVATFVRQE